MKGAGGEGEGNQEGGADVEKLGLARGCAGWGVCWWFRCNGGISGLMETLKRQGLIAGFRELVAALESLVVRIRASCTGVVVYRLPMVDADGVVPTYVPVEKIGSVTSVDPRALDLACQAFTQLTRRPGQKNTTAYRLPGCLFLSADLTGQVATVNALKDALKVQIVVVYPDIIARSRACSQLFPGVHMNHVYRHLYLIPESTTRINLTWQCQSPADVWISPGEAVRMAETALEETQRTSGSRGSDRQRALRIALDHFRALPAPKELTAQDLKGTDPHAVPYQLLKRNYVRPHPRAQIFSDPPGSRAVLTHPANLPLLVSGGEPRPDLRDLGDYDASRSHRRSDIKNGFQEISSALHIFGGYPSTSMALRRMKLRGKALERRQLLDVS